MKTVADYVKSDYRTASVFESMGIDFCCGGKKSLEEACEKEGVALEEVQTALQNLNQQAGSAPVAEAASDWPLDLLADYIEKVHHAFVNEQIPTILQHAEKVATVHGKKHPEFVKVAMLFQEGAGALTAHMKKEEFVLFPAVRNLAKGKFPISNVFQRIEMPVSQMEQEHDAEGERFRTIRELTHNYTPAEEACNTTRVLLEELKAFEEDLHKHIHLENNILFPRAVEMEKALG